MMIETRRNESGLVWDVIGRDGSHEMVPTVRDDQMLKRAVRRESRAMVRSVSWEIAHAGWQARLDASRAEQALRIGRALQRPAAEAMAQIAEQGQRMAEAYPAVAAQICEMMNDGLDVCMQIPNVVVRAYMSRYFDARQNRCRRPGDC
jgi:hypothetical protein